MTNDYELLRRWRQGDRNAADELLERHFAGLYLFFKSKVPDDARDLVQKTLLGCVEARDRLDETRSFRAYLFGVARKRLADHFRRYARKGARVDLGVSSVADLAPSPSGMVAVREQQRALLAALKRIPLDLQIALELFYWEELKLSEIAHVLGVAVGTVKSRLNRARERLREELANEALPDDVRHETLTNLEAWTRALRRQLADDED